MILLISICTGIATVCIAELFLAGLYTRRMQLRVQKEIEHSQVYSSNRGNRSSNEYYNDLFEGSEIYQQALRLNQSNTLSRPILLLLSIGSAIISAVAYFFSSSHLIAIATTAAVAVPGLLFWIKRHRVHHYRTMIKKSIPDLLDLVVLCLRGGQSIQSTIRSVADELRLVYAALSKELDMVVRDLDLGHNIDVAMRRFADRVEIDELKTLSSMIRESQRLGTDIASALHEHAELLRRTRENEAEEKAQKAAMKILIPSLICIFPGTFVVILGPAVFQIIDAFRINK